jgi:ribA/ribD-fused uncharacterized protein
MTITSQHCLERLHDLIPSLKPGRLEHVHTELIEQALLTHDVRLSWSWEPVGTIADLLQGLSLSPDEVVYMACPERGESCMGRVGDIQEANSFVADAMAQPEDVIIMGRDTRVIGLLDAQYRHASLRLRRLYPDPLHFYSVAHEYGELSNFALFSIRVDELSWPTSEHYFQAQKFEGTPDAEAIRRASGPMEAARMGRQRHRPLRKDWESVKVQVMRAALRAKFTQHPELQELLVATHPSKLVEHTPHDAYWGDGGDGKGQNWLGRLLMELREELRAS